jgi:hypothetical protein
MRNAKAQGWYRIIAAAYKLNHTQPRATQQLTCVARPQHMSVEAHSSGMQLHANTRACLRMSYISVHAMP